MPKQLTEEQLAKRRAKQKRHYEKHKQAILARARKKWQELTPEKKQEYYFKRKLRASQKLYYQKIREKKPAYYKQRYAENSEKILAQQATYRAKNREAINARQRARYHAEKLAILQGNNI